MFQIFLMLFFLAVVFEILRLTFRFAFIDLEFSIIAAFEDAFNDLHLEFTGTGVDN